MRVWECVNSQRFFSLLVSNSPLPPPPSPMALALEPPSPSSKRDDFAEQDDDDGFLYVLDCSSWVWKAGTCATETQEELGWDNEVDEAMQFPSSRSYYPPARARHTANPVTDDGNYTIVFGGYKTKSTIMMQKVNQNQTPQIQNSLKF